MGNVPPEPATCITSSTTAMALPISPNDRVSVYTIFENTSADNHPTIKN